jgi:hypothetical protein
MGAFSSQRNEKKEMSSCDILLIRYGIYIYIIYSAEMAGSEFDMLHTYGQ